MGAGPCPEPWTSLHEIWACLGLLSPQFHSNICVNGPAWLCPQVNFPFPGPKTIWAQVPAVPSNWKATPGHSHLLVPWLIPTLQV